MPIGSINGLTLQVGVGDMARAREFYDRLFGRPPDFIAAEDFQEYETQPGVWLQITTALEPGRMRRVRFGVPDLAAARQRLIADGFEATEPETLPQVVLWCDVADPWGNPLGLFQDLQRHPI
jgi:catechol 2,3-dioxygenase-like lactoylglutathione lyase family enzyme